MKNPLWLEILNEKRLPEQVSANFIERSLGKHPLPWVVEPRDSAFVVVATDGTAITIPIPKNSADEVIRLAEIINGDEAELSFAFTPATTTSVASVPMVHQP